MTTIQESIMTSSAEIPLRIERGHPTDEELAVLTAVLLARSRPVEPPAPVFVRWVAAYRAPQSWQTAA